MDRTFGPRLRFLFLARNHPSEREGSRGLPFRPLAQPFQAGLRVPAFFRHLPTIGNRP